MRKTGESNSAARTVVFGISVLLVVFAAWAAAREAIKAIRQLGLWAAAVEGARLASRFIYLFAFLLVVVNAFKGVRGVVRVFFGILLFTGSAGY